MTLPRITNDEILACQIATVERIPSELEALVSYELWRQAFDAGNGTLECADGVHRHRSDFVPGLSFDEVAQNRATTRRWQATHNGTRSTGRNGGRT